MKFLAGYSLFVLALVLIYMVNELRHCATKKDKASNISGIVIILPCILFFVLNFLGV